MLHISWRWHKPAFQNQAGVTVAVPAAHLHGHLHVGGQQGY
jgi:hypothetical protein